MAFDRLFTDTVTLIKQDGTTAEGIKAIGNYSPMLSTARPARAI